MLFDDNILCYNIHEDSHKPCPGSLLLESVFFVCLIQRIRFCIISQMNVWTQIHMNAL